MGRTLVERLHVRIHLTCHVTIILGWDFIRSIHYTKAFSIAMISVMSGGTKGKESNVEFPLEK